MCKYSRVNNSTSVIQYLQNEDILLYKPHKIITVKKFKIGTNLHSIFSPYSEFPYCSYNVLYSYFFPQLVSSVTFCFEGPFIFLSSNFFFLLWHWPWSQPSCFAGYLFVSSWPSSDQAFLLGILHGWFVSCSLYHTEKYMISLCPIMDRMKFDHLDKLMSTRFLHYKGTIFFFSINKEHGGSILWLFLSCMWKTMSLLSP